MSASNAAPSARRHVVAVRLLASFATAAAAGALGATPAGAAVSLLHTIGGDSGPCTTISRCPGHSFFYPGGVAVDPQGNVYVADTGNDQVEAIAPGGAQLWRRGLRGSRALGNFNNPRDVAYLGGKLYVADEGYNRIQVLNASNGAPVTAWTGLPSVLGVTAGVSASGTSVILVSEDTSNRVVVYSTAGAVLRTISAGLNAPRDAATDSAGNIYVADYANDRIAKFSPAGAFLKAWGGHGSGPGQMIRPYGVAVDSSNRVYVADSGNNRIEAFSSSGGFLRQYSSQGTSQSQFLQLRRVAVGSGSAPDVYGADLWDNKVLRFAQAGAFKQVYTGQVAKAAFFNEPSGIALDPAANQLFVADSVNQRMQRFAATAPFGFQLQWGQRGWGTKAKNGFNWPRDITYDAQSGTLWIADTKNQRLTEFTTGGAPTGRILGGVLGSGVGQMHWPFAVAAAGRYLVVADTFNSRLAVWDTQTGTMVRTIGGFNFPKDVAVSGTTAYVADTLNGRLVRVNWQTGAVLGSTGGLSAPAGVAVTPAGNIWVAATNNDRIVELPPGGGSPIASFGTGGSGSLQFDSPAHLEYLAGRLYIADEFNDRVEVYQVG